MISSWVVLYNTLVVKKLFTVFLFFSAGILSAFGIASFRFDNPVLTTFGVQKSEVVGFLPYWLMSKADKPYEKYITTLTYFGLTVDSDGSLQKLVKAGEEEPGWTTLRGDKFSAQSQNAKKHGLKQSLLVISGNDGAIGEMIADPVTSAKNLVSDAAPIMKERGFTDLNLDIETFMEASESARANFTIFARTVKEKLREQKLGTLTIDLIPIALMKQKLYDMKALGEIADRIVLMTYDYHYTGSLTSGSVAPLGGAGETLEFDVETAVKEALKIMPKEKILLGVPLYGYQWETIYAASESATIPGGSETASVRRITEKLTTCTDCIQGIDPISKTPYVIYPEGDVYKQAYYENEESMKEKIILAQKYKLGGVALWALGYEDDMLLRPLEKYKNTLDLSGF
jgi:spore germination protein